MKEELMNPNVLVADDSSTMRKIIIRSLQAIGVPNATEAKDGAEAIALFKQGGIDVVLTDWNMPGKTGLDVIKEIRAENTTVPIIMITTEAEKRRVLEAIQVGVSDYIIKPFEADMLREKLKKFINV
jgi:two-component system, chemotaxis family, chemotaxis protein CheY